MAARQITKRAAARRDLVEHYVYLAENASASVAERFLASAEASFQELVRQPLIGAPLPLNHAVLAGMRKWRIRDFDHFLIFYLPRANGVSIIRVLHSAQDWWTRLSETP